MQLLAEALVPQRGCPVAPGSLSQLVVAWCFVTGVWCSSSSKEFLVFVFKNKQTNKIFPLPLPRE